MLEISIEWSKFHHFNYKFFQRGRLANIKMMLIMKVKACIENDLIAFPFGELTPAKFNSHQTSPASVQMEGHLCKNSVLRTKTLPTL